MRRNRLAYQLYVCFIFFEMQYPNTLQMFPVLLSASLGMIQVVVLGHQDGNCHLLTGG